MDRDTDSNSSVPSHFEDRAKVKFQKRHGKYRPSIISGSRSPGSSGRERESIMSDVSIRLDLTQLRTVKRPTTDSETLVHFLKGNIGTGSMAMPEAFMNSGLWVGFASIPIVGLLCTHCMFLILRVSRKLCHLSKKGSLSYEETGEMALAYGPEPLRKWSKHFFYFITSFLVLTQLGFCCVYFVFISQNLYQAVECISGGTSLSQFDYMAIVLIPVMLVCYIPDLKYLAPISMIASSTQLLGMIITFYYLFRDLPEVEMKVPAFAGWKGLPLFLGTALYAFEGIGLVLPLENNMKTPNHLPGWNGVLNTGMLLVMCTYAALGFFGYLRYGDTILGSVTLNLPGDEIAAQAVKLLMALAIFLTYPLQYYVALSVTLPGFLEWFSSDKAKVVAEYCFRSVLVFVTFVFATLIPNVGLFINLVGAVCSSSLALIFPPFIDTVSEWPNLGKYRWKLCKNVFISMVGIFGFVTGGFSSIKAIVKFLQEGEQAVTSGCE